MITLTLTNWSEFRIEHTRHNGEVQIFNLDLANDSGSDAACRLGAFLLGLARFSNMRMAPGPLDSIAPAHVEVERMVIAGLPETDFLMHLSLLRRAEQEKDETLIPKALAFLEKAASAGHAQAVGFLKEWSSIRKGVEFAIRNLPRDG